MMYALYIKENFNSNNTTCLIFMAAVRNRASQVMYCQSPPIIPFSLPTVCLQLNYNHRWQHVQLSSRHHMAVCMKSDLHYCFKAIETGQCTSHCSWKMNWLRCRIWNDCELLWKTTQNVFDLHLQHHIPDGVGLWLMMAESETQSWLLFRAQTQHVP